MKRFGQKKIDLILPSSPNVPVSLSFAWPGTRTQLDCGPGREHLLVTFIDGAFCWLVLNVQDVKLAREDPIWNSEWRQE